VDVHVEVNYNWIIAKQLPDVLKADRYQEAPPPAKLTVSPKAPVGDPRVLLHVAVIGDNSVAAAMRAGFCR